MGAPKYIKQNDNNSIIAGDFNTPLIAIDRPFVQKINKATVVLNDTIVQLDLIDIYRTFDHKTAKYTFFSSAHGTFSRIDHMLGHKRSLNKFKSIEIISCTFPQQQWYKTRNQLQEEKWEKHKHMETKQQVSTKTNGSMKKSRRKSESTST